VTHGHQRPRRRGDNIPTIADYAGWNEDAEIMWYEENKYDMMHADEIVDDPAEDGWWEEDEDG
jgi:hypothetical protein